jgi:trigger factor
MQVSVENTGKLERRLTISVPAEQYESQVRARIDQMSRSMRIKGFRPGKVPTKVIEQRFGREVRGEALSAILRDTFSQAVRQENLRLAGNPNIETTGEPEDGQIVYTATFEVMPEIGAVDVSALEVVRPTATVEDADIDTMIETLRKQRRSWTEVERPARAGDMVLFESWAMADGQRIPPEGVERSGTVVGSGALFADLERQLEGLATGDERTLRVAFPENYRVPTLAGKSAELTVTIKRVSEAHMPDVDADFIRGFGVASGDLEQFRKEVRANLERELKGALMVRLKRQVAEKLVAAYEHMEFPQRMVDAEAESLARQAEAQAEQAGQKGFKADPAQLREPARHRVIAAVLLGEIARQQNLRLDQARVREMMEAIASTYEEPEQVIELYRRDEQLMAGLQNRVLEDQVIDWIAEHARHSDQPLSFDEVMRPSQPA